MIPTSITVQCLHYFQAKQREDILKSTVQYPRLCDGYAKPEEHVYSLGREFCEQIMHRIQLN
jgi:hypothetical protein